MILTFKMDFGQGFVDVPAPMNAAGIMMHVVFTDRHPNASVSGLDLEWTGETAKKLKTYKLAGLTGGEGIYEGVGLQIYNCDLFFDGYVDLQDEKTLWQCDSVVAPAVQYARVDWLSWRAGSISFGYLRKLSVGHPGRIIPATDYKKTPYTITKYRTRAEKITMELAILGTLKEIYDITRNIGQLIAKMAGDATSTATTLGLVIATLLADLLIIALYVVYLLLVLLALINLVIQIVKFYFQIKKYKLCMTYETGFKRICEYFGMRFSSTILQQGSYVGTTWMPKKNIIPNPANPLLQFLRPADENVGFPTNLKVHGHYDGNCEQFIMDAETFFDAEINILPDPITGVLTLYFENRFFFNNVAVFTIPNTGKQGNTFNLPEPFGTNLSECPSNYLVEFQIDQSDENTFNRYAGTTCECVVSPIIVNNILRVAHQKGVDKILPAAHAKRKEYLNDVELRLNRLFGHMNSLNSMSHSMVGAIITHTAQIVALYGGHSPSQIPALSSFTPIAARIGWLELSSDDFSVPKIFIGYDDRGDWKIHPQSQVNMSAEMLAQRFHFKNLATRGNQQLKFYNKQFKFCCSDFRKISQSNVVTVPGGGLGKLISFTWNLDQEMAVDVTYVTFVTSTNNLKETITIDGN